MFENANPNNPGQGAGQSVNPAGPPAAAGTKPGQAGVEDIFSQMDGGKSAKPAVLNPVSPSSRPPENDPAGQAVFKKSMDGKRLLLAGLGLGGLILIFIGAWYSYNILLPKSQEGKVKNNTEENQNPAVTPAASENQNPALSAGEEPKAADNTSAPAEEEGNEDLLGTEILREQMANPLEGPGDEEKANPALDSNTDSDNDGLTDAEEKSLGTNPQKLDSDDDGLFDKEEVNIYKTDPMNSDTDGDGFTDGSEVKNGYNPKGSGKLYEVMP